MILNLPNILTLMRIVLIPVLVLAFYYPVAWANIAATVIFFIAGVTDWLDGYLARRMGVSSRFGAFLDPVADKLMVAVALILIVDLNPTPYASYWIAIPAAIIVGREITISALREWMSEIGASSKVAVSMLGKIKTAAQMGSLGLLIYHEPLMGQSMALWGLALLYLAAILTIWSMFGYIKSAWPSLSESS
ncbi:MAG TPA: CDP-diacylglycerol--glycerol-3-phosphate 3-phosphatidyltransferase [Ectothiorhodospiraceae bacterium]|nr:CDP-diacylglycerol--glycerol-3-phosphate 3-phosphatidyltransferase [Ectothiorhodospiraceae bacterium]